MLNRFWCYCNKQWDFRGICALLTKSAFREALLTKSAFTEAQDKKQWKKKKKGGGKEKEPVFLVVPRAGFVLPIAVKASKSFCTHSTTSPQDSPGRAGWMLMACIKNQITNKSKSTGSSHPLHTPLRVGPQSKLLLARRGIDLLGLINVFKHTTDK